MTISPTFDTLTLGSGGTFNGTISGSPTLSWTPSWTGLQTFAGGAAITGGSVGGTFTGSATWSALQTYSAGLTVPNGSGAVSAPQYNTPGNTFTGTSNAIPPRLNLNLNLAGTISGQSYVNFLTVSGDNANAFNGSNGGAWTQGIVHNVGGSNVNGGRGLLWGQLNISSLTNPALEMLGANFSIFANGPTNGAFLQPLSTSVQVASGADAGNTVAEMLVAVKSGATVADKCFLQFTYGPGDVVAGSGQDACLRFAAAANATSGFPGAGTLISVGNGGEAWPVNTTTGTILGVTLQTAQQGNGRVVHFIAPQAFAGVDFQSVNFTQASGFAFRSAGFSVDGTGQARIANGILGTTTTGLKLDIDQQIVTAVAVAAGGGGGGTGTNDYYVGDILTAGNGGQYQVASVSSGAVASVTLMVPGVSASPPSNPVATTGGSGTGCTLNLTWSSSRTTLGLNPSGGAVSFGGGSQNTLTVTPGSTSATAIAVSQSGTGGVTFGSATLTAGAANFGGFVKVTGTNQLQVGDNFTNNNVLQLTPSTNVGTPSLSVTGNATDIPMAIDTKGAGLLTLQAGATGAIKFGSTGSWTANGSVATGLTSVGPTGSHTTVQEWLTVTNSSGTVRYIPCF